MRFGQRYEPNHSRNRGAALRGHSALIGRLAVATIVASLVSACGGGSGLVPPPFTGVSGSVTNTRGGPAVSGATVTATSTPVTATTNVQGAYALTLNPGTYDILVGAPGMAASKFQGVVVNANKATTANLIMFPPFDPSKPISAPTIAVSGLSPGQTVTGTLTFTVTVTAAIAVRRIDLRSNNVNALPQSSFADSSTANVSLDSTKLANGPAFVDIISYDLNQNVAEYLVSFTVNNSVSGSPPTVPTGLSLAAVTTGQSLSLFTTQRAQVFSTLGIKQDPTVLNVQGRTIHILTAPSNATLFVQVSWNPVVGASGYKVYRGFNAGSLAPVAQVPTSPTPVYNDADPSLAPGVPVFYAVSSFNAGGDSATTGAVSVTPLGSFNVSLVSPPNNATGVSRSPTFTWTAAPLVGTGQGYDIVVQGLNDALPAWQTTGFSILSTSSTTNVALGAPLLPPCAICPLQSGKVYQWDVYEAVGQTVYSTDPASGLTNSFALSIANAGYLGIGTVPTGSLNGPFSFTTQ